MVGQAEQERQHADVDVGEIADALAQHRRGVSREPVAPLEHHDVERLLGAEILADQLSTRARQLLVVEDGELNVEDRRFLGARAALDSRAELAEPLARARDRGVEALDLGGDPFVGDDAMADVGHLPAQEVHVSDDDARRGGNAPDLIDPLPLPELVGDERGDGVDRLLGVVASARSTIDAPHSAASIMTPMMLLPFTSVPSREIVISLRNFAESFTISAAGRACRPFLLRIWTVLSTISGSRRRGRRQR